jgi:broad specificity phosphatase PhoE
LKFSEKHNTKLMTKNKKNTDVYLIRHGITDWIEQGKIAGQSDRPLSDFGLEQAELTGKAMRGVKAAHLFCSPLIRARQTAQPISRATGLEPEIIDGLMEMDFGIMEGKRNYWGKLRDKKFLLRMYLNLRRAINIFSGEKNDQFSERVRIAWQGIRAQADGRPLIVVAHAGVLRNILYFELGGHLSDMRFNLDACSISIIEISPDNPTRLVQPNGVAHLNGKIHP